MVLVLRYIHADTVKNRRRKRYFLVHRENDFDASDIDENRLYREEHSAVVDLLTNHREY